MIDRMRAELRKSRCVSMRTSYLPRICRLIPCDLTPYTPSKNMAELNANPMNSVGMILIYDHLNHANDFSRCSSCIFKI